MNNDEDAQVSQGSVPTRDSAKDATQQPHKHAASGISSAAVPLITSILTVIAAGMMLFSGLRQNIGVDVLWPDSGPGDALIIYGAAFGVIALLLFMLAAWRLAAQINAIYVAVTRDRPNPEL